MGKEFWWFFDAIVLATFIIYIFKNAKNGFLKSAFTIGLTVIAVVVSIPLSKTVSYSVYNDYFKEKNIKAVKEITSNYNVKQDIAEYINLKYGVEVTEAQIADTVNSVSNNKACEQISSLINAQKGYTVVSENDIFSAISNNFNTDITEKLDDKIPSWAVNNVLKNVNNDADLLMDTTKALINSDDDSSAKFIEENYIRKFYTNIISIIAFAIIFSLITLIGRILFAVFGIDKLENAGGINTFAGGVLGFIEACFVIYVFSLLVKAIIIISSGNMVFFNEETVKNSILFRLFYNLDIIA